MKDTTYEVVIQPNGHATAFPPGGGFIEIGQVRSSDGEWFGLDTNKTLTPDHGLPTQDGVVQCLMRRAGLGEDFTVVDAEGE